MKIYSLNIGKTLAKINIHKQHANFWLGVQFPY